MTKRLLRKFLKLLRSNPELLFRHIWWRVLSKVPDTLLPSSRFEGRVNGLRFQFDLSLDRNIKRMYLRCNEIEVVSVINRALKNGDVFIDVGANIGYLTAYSAGVVGTLGQVHAFEPVPEYFDRLRWGSEQNPDYDIKVNRCAVGEDPGNEKIAVTSRKIIGFIAMVPGIMGPERTSYSVSVPIVRVIPRGV